MANLEARAAFHGEQEALHAQQEVHHREQAASEGTAYHETRYTRGPRQGVWQRVSSFGPTDLDFV